MRKGIVIGFVLLVWVVSVLVACRPTTRVAAKSMVTWERIDGHYGRTSRIPVPHGWLVARSSRYGHSLVFVLDAAHDWLKPELGDK